MKLNEFLKQCYEKNIVKSVTVFVVISWTVIQVSHVTHEAIGLPEEFVSSLIILFFCILPFYIFNVWRRFGKDHSFEDLSESEQLESRSFRKTYMQGLGLVSFFSIFMIVLVTANKFFAKETKLSIEKQTHLDKIAVLHFENNTPSEENEIIGQMASDWISHGLVKEGASKVISSDIINGYADIIEANQIRIPQIEFLNKYLQPGMIIKGSFFQSDGELIFQSAIINGINNESLYTFEEERCDENSPLTCIEQVKQRILSYLINQDGTNIVLEDYPPNFEAYKKMLKAKEVKDYVSEEYITYLEEAIALDDSYFEPRVSRISYYYNIGDTEKALKLIDDIQSSEIETDRQRNIVLLYENLLAGRNAETFKAMQNEYDLAPYDLANNTSMMFVALQLVNQPFLVDSIYAQVNEELMNASDCAVCIDRVKMKMDAYLALDQPEKVINMYGEYSNLQYDIDILRPTLTAYIRLDKKDIVEQILSKSSSFLSAEESQELSYHIQTQSIIYDFQLDETALVSSLPYSIVKTFGKKNYSEVIQAFESDENDLSDQKAYYLASLFYSGKSGDVQTIVDDLLVKSEETDFGYNSYLLSQFYALTGNETEMYKYLENAIKQGYYFTDTTFENDAVFKAYSKTEKFQQLINYWSQWIS